MWLALLIACGLLGLVAISLPFFGSRRPWEAEPPSEIDQLFAKKARILRSIKDVDHEREAGLLSEDDWRETRSEYVDEAVRLNREIASRTGVDPTAAEAVR